jgi:hypothetical protein
LVDRACEIIRVQRNNRTLKRIDDVFRGIDDEHPNQAGSGYFSITTTSHRHQALGFVPE